MLRKEGEYKVTVLIHAIDIMGGAEKHAAKLGEALAEGHSREVTVIAPNLLDRNADERVGKLRIIRLPVPSWLGSHIATIPGVNQPHARSSWIARRGYHAWLLWKLSTEARRSPADVIHAHTMLIPALAAKLSGKPFVVTLHGGEINRVVSAGGFTRWVYRRILSAASGIIAVSPDLKAKTEALGISPDRIAYIPNGVTFRPRSRSIPRDSRLRIAYFGRLEYVKGTDVLLSAYEQIHRMNPDVVLEIAGIGSEEGRLREIAQPYGNNIVFLGRLDEAELADLLDRADVVVLPSRNEGLPLALLEAMAAGCPVVASRVGGIPDFVPESDGVLVDPEDPQALSNAIVRLLRSAELRLTLGQKNAERVREEFSWDSIGAATDEILARAAHRER